MVPGFTSRSLYAREALAATAVAYADVAKIEIEDDRDDYAAVFHSDDDLDEDVVDAFANHVLAETVSRRTRIGARVR